MYFQSHTTFRGAGESGGWVCYFGVSSVSLCSSFSHCTVCHPQLKACMWWCAIWGIGSLPRQLLFCGQLMQCNAWDSIPCASLFSDGHFLEGSLWRLSCQVLWMSVSLGVNYDTKRVINPLAILYTDQLSQIQIQQLQHPAGNLSWDERQWHPPC